MHLASGSEPFILTLYLHAAHRDTSDGLRTWHCAGLRSSFPFYELSVKIDSSVFNCDHKSHDVLSEQHIEYNVYTVYA